MKRHRATRRATRRATHHVLIGGLARLKYFEYLTSVGLEIGPGQDLVVGDDV
jgi:hypothetical protein